MSTIEEARGRVKHVDEFFKLFNNIQELSQFDDDILVLCETLVAHKTFLIGRGMEKFIGRCRI